MQATKRAANCLCFKGYTLLKNQSTSQIFPYHSQETALPLIGGLAAHPAEDEGDGSQAKEDRGRGPQLVLHNSIVDRVSPEQGCAQEYLRSSS